MGAPARRPALRAAAAGKPSCTARRECWGGLAGIREQPGPRRTIRRLTERSRVCRSSAVAATPAIWATLARTSSLNTRMPLPRYSTILGWSPNSRGVGAWACFETAAGAASGGPPAPPAASENRRLHPKPNSAGHLACWLGNPDLAVSLIHGRVAAGKAWVPAHRRGAGPAWAAESRAEPARQSAARPARLDMWPRTDRT